MGMEMRLVTTRCETFEITWFVELMDTVELALILRPQVTTVATR
jgi:hypothetical protein